MTRQNINSNLQEDTESGSSYDAEVLLDILGNATRRKVLKLLSDEPRYFNQLSRDIGISQQAIMRHLNIMEESGLIVSYDKKSELGAPDRKYYKLNKSLNLTVNLSEDVVYVAVTELSEDYSAPDEVEDELEELYELLSDLDSSDTSDLQYTLKQTKLVLNEIDKHLSELEEKRNFLLQVRQHVMSKVHSSIITNIHDELHRKVMYSITDQDNRTRANSITEIAENIDIQERLVKDALKELRTRFSSRAKRRIFDNL